MKAGSQSVEKCSQSMKKGRLAKRAYRNMEIKPVLWSDTPGVLRPSKLPHWLRVVLLQ